MPPRSTRKASSSPRRWNGNSGSGRRRNSSWRARGCLSSCPRPTCSPESRPAMTDTLMMIAGLLADEAPKDTGPDFGKASPFGLLIVVLLLIGTLFLVRSMNRHLKRLPESFDRENPESDQAVDEGTVEPDAGNKAP